MGIGLPVLFATISQASRSRWAATSTALVYTLFIIAEILILPLFPAQPKLGPVFFPVTHLVPAKFPILIVVPALALDLLWHRLRNWKPWQIALVSGVLFIAVLTAVEWPFANFLLSDASKNRFFGTIYFQYNSRADGYDRLRQFFSPDHGAALYLGLLRSALYASISTWIGLLFGRWMRGVQR
jgi:small nuclear ribonucleoprotein (snRNP)-like protein